MANLKKIGFTLPDFAAFVVILALFGGFLYVGRHWAAPLQTPAEVMELSYSSLPTAVFLSLSRITIAFVVCLITSLLVGYWAAHSKVAEYILIPLIDIGQSIPVLGFLPGLVLAFMALFPDSHVGLEIAAVLTLYTGMAWNLMLSFYGSIKTIPREYFDIVRAYGYGRLGTFFRLELPYATNGIVWNSMLSVAGGWFFLSVCESFTLGDKSFRLMGLGSFMSQAAEQGNYMAIAAGVAIMVAILLLGDYFLWRPLLRWSEHFQRNPNLEETDDVADRMVSFFAKSQFATTILKRFGRRFASRLFVVSRRMDRLQRRRISGKWLLGVAAVVVALISLSALYTGWAMLSSIAREEWFLIFRNAGWSMLRVFAALAICIVLMVPLGLYVGSRPNLVKRLQPLIQVIAAFPAPMIFPILISVFLWLHIPLSFGAVVLMMTGAQWYLLFNTISGAATVPPAMADVARLSGFSSARTMLQVYFPAAFPQILTGLITAAGGAWNTSIVAELVTFRGQEFIAPGLGSYIAKAAYNAKYAELFAAVTVMVLLVVLLNRFFWAYLYNLAESRYRLDA